MNTNWHPALRALVVALAVVSLAVLVFARPPVPEVGSLGGMRVDFGYSRTAVARSQTFLLCGDPSAAELFSECKPDTKPGTPRPEITGVAWTGDFVPADPAIKDRCERLAGSGTAFPSSQVRVTATNFDLKGITLAMAVEPRTPEEVAPGTYCSTALISRQGELQPVERTVVIDLRDKYHPWIWIRVLLVLFYGAVLGALLKWIADNVGQQREQQKADNPARDGSVLDALAGHPGLTIAVVTAIVVAVFGMQSQWVSSTTFSDGFLDYLALFGWAFAGQLAGQTLFDVAGNAKSAMKAAGRDGGDHQIARPGAQGDARSEGPDSQVADDQVADEQVADEQVADEQVADEQVADEQVADEQVADEQVADEQVADEQVADEQVADEQVADEQVADEQVAQGLPPGDHAVDQVGDHPRGQSAPGDQPANGRVATPDAPPAGEQDQLVASAPGDPGEQHR